MPLAATLALLALAGEPAAPAAAEPPPAPQAARFAPLRSSERAYARLGPAGPYFPDAALRKGRSGEAVIACRVATAAGRLADCEVVSETPAGLNFGIAAVVMARRGHVLAPEGAPAGEPIRLHVPFTPGAPVDTGR